MFLSNCVFDDDHYQETSSSEEGSLKPQHDFSMPPGIVKTHLRQDCQSDREKLSKESLTLYN